MSTSPVHRIAASAILAFAVAATAAACGGRVGPAGRLAASSEPAPTATSAIDLPTGSPDGSATGSAQPSAPPSSEPAATPTRAPSAGAATTGGGAPPRSTPTPAPLPDLSAIEQLLDDIDDALADDAGAPSQEGSTE